MRRELKVGGRQRTTLFMGVGGIKEEEKKKQEKGRQEKGKGKRKKR